MPFGKAINFRFECYPLLYQLIRLANPKQFLKLEEINSILQLMPYL